MVTIRMPVSAMGSFVSVAFVISHDVSISEMVESPWPIPAVFPEINVNSR